MMVLKFTYKKDQCCGGDYVKITIDKSQNDLGKDSILTINKKYNIDTMEVEIEDNRIIIFLNEKTLLIYSFYNLLMIIKKLYTQF